MNNLDRYIYIYIYIKHIVALACDQMRSEIDCPKKQLWESAEMYKSV